MQQNDDDRLPDKQPIDMTSDELLDYAIAPEVAERVKRIAKPQDDPDCNPQTES
jgi:hypothetical protein